MWLVATVLDSAGPELSEKWRHDLLQNLQDSREENLTLKAEELHPLRVPQSLATMAYAASRGS